tara:strand:- start:46 stop:408 length:363 start_codon:yes stop_codon:yes gene_type:complete
MSGRYTKKKKLKKNTITRTTGKATINPDRDIKDKKGTKVGVRAYNTVTHDKKKTKTYKDTYLNRLRFKVEDKLTTRKNKKVEEERKKDKTGKKKYRKKFVITKHSKKRGRTMIGPYRANK